MKNTGKCTVLRDYQSYIIKLVVFKLVLVEISLGTLTYERDRVLLLWLDQGLGGVLGAAHVASSLASHWNPSYPSH